MIRSRSNLARFKLWFFRWNNSLIWGNFTRELFTGSGSDHRNILNAACTGKCNSGTESSYRDSFSKCGAPVKLLLQITQLALTARAGSRTFAPMAAFLSNKRNIVFICNSLADFL